MAYSRPAPTRRTPRSAALVVVIAAIAAVPGYRSLRASSATAAPPIAPPSFSTASPAPFLRSEHPGPPGEGDGGLAGGVLGEADGAVPDRTTPFDDEVPAVVNLDPALLAALRRAATAAADDGVELYVDSGWRSPAYQEQLLQEAISKYGSEEEAARWVATPDTSAHVSGEAVDVGPSAATAWLARHGAGYGLCPVYRNEPWHYELRPEAVGDSCPRQYADPTDDPRMQP